MSVRTAHTEKLHPEEAARELRAAIAPVEPTVVLYFASSRHDPKALAEAMLLAFPGAVVAGCTTAGELEGARFRKGTVVAMGLGSDVVRNASSLVLPNVGGEPDLRAALGPLEAELGKPLSSLDPSQYVGVLLVDGLCMAEERLMDRLGDLTDVPIVGGSAGDDLAFRTTWIATKGRAHTGAALLLLLEPAVAFRVLKTQSFRPLEQTLRVTSADCEARVVHAFDDKPAASRYAEVLSIPPSELPSHFMRHPLGLMVGDEPFVRSPQQLRGESVVFYCNVQEGIQLRVLEATDVVEDTRRALEAAREELGGASAIIDFDCVLRTAEIEATGRMDAYGALFSSTPAIGFSTYGEQFLGHVNQTATMLLLGRP